MKTLTSLTMALAFFACLFQGCKTVKEIPVVQLSGKWVLQLFDGQTASESFKGTIPTIEFDVTGKRISGSGGCNNYSGSFNLSGNEFSAPDIIATEMMCFKENQENAFFRLLNNVSTISLDGEKLIFAQNGKQVLVFEKAKSLDIADLFGLWTLSEIEGAPVDMLFTGTLPTVEFNAAENRLTGNAGCNMYNAPFELTGNTLSVQNPMATRRACDSLNGETKFLRLLSGTATIEVENNALIFKKDGIVQLKFVK